MKTRGDRILDLVARSGGCTNAALLAQDLHLKQESVARGVRELLTANRIEHTWDGVGLELTAGERKSRTEDERIGNRPEKKR